MTEQDIICGHRKFDISLGMRVWYRFDRNSPLKHKAWLTGRKNWLGHYQILMVDADFVLDGKWVRLSDLKPRDEGGGIFGLE